MTRADKVGHLAEDTTVKPPPRSAAPIMLPLRSTPYRKKYLNREHAYSQRLGTPGVDYDELGAEMGPNARVWHQYVNESDRMDGELVDGWNKTLDVMLIFAALFSAISTAFVIESSKSLKPDPAETSSQTLLTIAQSLRPMSAGLPINSSSELDTATDEFYPPASMVVVNVLWFTSLSLSVAVSLVCILAKEWCYSFMTGRFGPVLRQARLRHRRWGGIQQWKMKEILAVLPLFMHAALLLFAIGLSVYLLDLNITVGLPVAVITALATAFYVVTAMLSAIFWLCPYTTSAAKVISLSWNAVLRSRHARGLVTRLVALYIKLFAGNGRSDDSFGFYSMYETSMEQAERIVNRWMQRARIGFIKRRNILADPQTPMDTITSSMLCWMVTNCEDSGSVDLALQAVAGAHPSKLPRRPLWEGNWVQLVADRLRSCLESVENMGVGPRGPEYHKLLEASSLYSRAFRFLINHVNGEGYRLNRTDADLLYFELDTGDESLPEGLSGELGLALMKVFEDSNVLVEHCLHQSVGRADLAAFHLNNQLATIEKDRYRVAYQPPRQNDMRWMLLRRHLSDEGVTLPHSALIAVIDGITKSYLCMYQSCQEISLLVDLLATSPESVMLRRAIGICLTIVAFKYCNYPALVSDEDEERTIHDQRTARVQEVYSKLTSVEISAPETIRLLEFGLLSLLDCDNYTSDRSEAGSRAISRLLNALHRLKDPKKKYSDPPVIRGTDARNRHVAYIISGWLKKGHRNSSNGIYNLLCLMNYPIMPPNFDACKELGATVATPLLKLMLFTDSLTLKIACLQGMRHTLGLGVALRDGVLTYFFKMWEESYTISRACDEFLRESLDLLRPLYQSAKDTSLDPEIAPYTMHFLWNFAGLVLSICRRDLLDSPARALGLFVEFESQVPMEPKVPDGSSTRSTLSLQLPHGFRLPRNQCDTAILDSWIAGLLHLCQVNPAGLLHSELLDDIITVYAETSPDLCPSQTLLDTVLASIHPRSEIMENESPLTWLQILNHLKSRCQSILLQQRVGANIQQQESGAAELESTTAGSGVEGETDPAATVGPSDENSETSDSESTES